jgi:hypothetical protein
MTVKPIADLGFAINRNSTTSTFHEVTVHPTFFFDNASERQKVSAEVWASTSPYRWDSQRTELGLVQAQVRPNTPMSNLWLDNLEQRMEGGRAYKVINKDDMTYFDVREDQMLQAILKHGIQAGGKIGGEWVFAMNGTQCKCFLVDGKEYQEALARVAIAPAVMVKASLRNLKIGSIYCNKNATEEFIYVGFISHQKLVSYEQRDHWNGRVLAPAVFTTVKKHTFLAKNRSWFATVPAPLVFEAPSTVYETGRSISVADLINKINTVDTTRFGATQKSEALTIAQNAV